MLIAGSILYFLFGHQFIKTAHETGAIETLTRIIKADEYASWYYYFGIADIADRLFLDSNVYFLLILFFFIILFKITKKAIIKLIFLSAVFFVGIIFGLLFWNKIALPFHNLWGVIGPLEAIKYNPANNIIRFIVFILFPILILSVTYLFNISGFRQICFDIDKYPKKDTNNDQNNLQLVKKVIFFLLLIVFTLLIAINTPTYHSSKGLDTFHDGEYLGTSMYSVKGGVPYKDFFVDHGIFQDYLSPIIAFNLFGKSIGSARTFNSIIKLLAYISLSLFLLLLYHGNYLYSFGTLAILSSLPTLILPRDVTTFAFLITVILLYAFINSNFHKADSKIFFFINYLFSFIPLASFSYSVDRGFYLFGAYLIISPILYFTFFRRSAFHINYLVSSFLGLLSAIILLGLLLHGNFSEFFSITFLIMPKTKELREGFIYPIFRVEFLISCILIAANIYFVSFNFIKEFHTNSGKAVMSIKKFIEHNFIEICLLLVSIFFFRTALGRSDCEHIVTSISITYILSIYLMFKYYFHPAFHGNGFIKDLFKYLLTFVVMLIFAFDIYRVYHYNLIIDNFPFQKRDSMFIWNNHWATISFLRNNLGDKEDFITMTSEAIWYYYTDKPCPIRFPIVWLAGPYFYQNEIVEELRMKRVKFIIYKNNHWANTIDGINNETRLPIVVDYIKRNYVLLKNIDDNEIWIHR